MALVDHVAGEFAALVGYGAARAVRALRGRKRRRVQKSQLREWRKPVEAPGPEDHRSFIGELSYGGGGVNLVNVHLFVETMPFGGTGSAGLGPTTASMASTRSHTPSRGNSAVFGAAFALGAICKLGVEAGSRGAD